MEPVDDSELLRRYADENAEGAFAELVRRRVDFVYAGALRRVGGDVHLAEDVTQQVFTALARGAGELVRHPALSAWLFTTTRNLAAQVVRGERRRRAREQEAHTMMTNEGSETAVGAVLESSAVEWERLRPVLDAALDDLNERDREAVLLRFNEGRSFAEVGVRLRLAENSARMRVGRALDKLQVALGKRGVTSTTAAVGLALGNQALASAPAGLAATVTGAALAGMGVAGVTGSAGSAMAFMGTIKLQWGIAGALMVAGTAGWVAQSRVDAALREEIAALRQQRLAPTVVAELQAENRRLAVAVAEVAALRKDEVELARLRAEVDAVKARQQAAVRSAAEARAKRAAEIAAMPVYTEAQVEVQPDAKFQARPTIPKVLRDLGRGGEARISYVVNADGEVTDVQALSSTHPEWAEAAVAAVKQWQFAPARKNGEAVNVRKEIPVVFTMEVQTGATKGQGRRLWF